MEEHPSLKFQRGEVTSFHDAMRVLVQQQEFEYQRIREMARKSSEYGGVTPEDVNEARHAIKVVEQQVTLATDLYQKIMAPALYQVAEALRAQHDPLLQSIATAIITNDYSDLAL